jgi:3-isopropylmalate/(R)-2-methylmalate dehydratase small subunit
MASTSATGPKKIEGVGGRGLVLRGNDIDTDQIIPARYLRTITFVGLEDHVFRDVRFTADGVPKDHPFNDGRAREASILVVNKNFGCGSSREHAPQALHRFGICAVVGESFAEIFAGNCAALGVPAVIASEDAIAALMDALELDPSQRLELSLVDMTLRSRAGVFAVALPDAVRTSLRTGAWDAMGVLASAADQIRATAERVPYIRGF